MWWIGRARARGGCWSGGGGAGVGGRDLRGVGALQRWPASAILWMLPLIVAAVWPISHTDTHKHTHTHTHTHSQTHTHTHKHKHKHT